MTLDERLREIEEFYENTDEEDVLKLIAAFQKLLEQRDEWSALSFDDGTLIKKEDQELLEMLK